MTRGALAAWLVSAVTACACGRADEAAPSLAARPAATASAAAGEAVPHGDHNPHFGGLVLMNGDLHFEIVADRRGRYRLYFSDATRAELPAATASHVQVTVSQKGRAPQVVAMAIDDSGESWRGQGGPVDDLAATLRVEYTSRGKPYFIDVPFPR